MSEATLQDGGFVNSFGWLDGGGDRLLSMGDDGITVVRPRRLGASEARDAETIKR